MTGLNRVEVAVKKLLSWRQKKVNALESILFGWETLLIQRNSPFCYHLEKGNLNLSYAAWEVCQYFDHIQNLLIKSLDLTTLINIWLTFIHPIKTEWDYLMSLCTKNLCVAVYNCTVSQFILGSIATLSFWHQGSMSSLALLLSVTFSFFLLTRPFPLPASATNLASFKYLHSWWWKRGNNGKLNRDKCETALASKQGS